MLGQQISCRSVIGLLSGLVLPPFRRLNTSLLQQPWCPEPRRLEAHAVRRSALTDSNGSISNRCCLGLTCLKWRGNGELSALDLRLVMDRLARVDRHVAALCQNNGDREPCPMIS